MREGDPGMSQDEQREALQKLRDGEVNVLVATSIAEEGLDIPEVDHVIFYEPVPSEIRYIQRRGRTGRRVAGKVTILIAENTLDEAFYWSSLTRARKMKKIIRQLNRKLPEMLRERLKPTVKPALTVLRPRERLVPEALAKEAVTKPQLERVVRRELWTPVAYKTKGLSVALKWIMENLPEGVTSIEDIVIKAVEETGLEKASVETAIWRLIQQGQLYQPQPGKIRKL
jgi:Fanconi anemia group M protein